MSPYRIAAAVLIAIILNVNASAAMVVLTDGRIYEYSEVLAQDDERVLLLMDGGRVQLPRRMIVALDADAAPRRNTGRVIISGFATPTPARQEPRIEPALDVAADEPAEIVELAKRETPAAVLPVPINPNEQRELIETIEALRSGDITQRRGAQERLTAAGDVGLGMLVLHGLYHDLPSVRTQSAELLGQLGGQRVLKHLLEAFFAAATPTIPPYQVDYIQVLSAQIARLTGRDFSFYIRGTGAPAAAQQMVDWWRQNYAALPPQLGEPELEPKDPDYASHLAALRTLTLQPRLFGGSNLPPEITTATAVNSPSEQRFVGTIPTLPRNQPFYVDRQTSTSFAPSVEKVPDEAYTEPGEIRTNVYQQRIVDSLRQ